MRSVVMVMGLAVVLMLAGCAAPADEYGPDAADRLQAGVLEVTEASASSDHADALTNLAELGVALADARARGAVTAERFESISAAIELVRTDLEAAIKAEAPEPTPPTQPEVQDNEPDKGNSGKGNGNDGNNGKDKKGDKKKGKG